MTKNDKKTAENDKNQHRASTSLGSGGSAPDTAVTLPSSDSHFITYNHKTGVWEPLSEPLPTSLLPYGNSRYKVIYSVSAGVDYGEGLFLCWNYSTRSWVKLESIPFGDPEFIAPVDNGGRHIC